MENLTFWRMIRCYYTWWVLLIHKIWLLLIHNCFFFFINWPCWLILHTRFGSITAVSIHLICLAHKLLHSWLECAPMRIVFVSCYRNDLSWYWTEELANFLSIVNRSISSLWRRLSLRSWKTKCLSGFSW